MPLVTPSFSNEYLYLVDTEAVTLYRKLADGQFDNGTSVANALRLAVSKEQPIGGTGAKVIARLDWLLWSVQTSTPAPKTGDYLLDSTGARWVLSGVEVQAWGARFFAHSVLER